MTGSGGNGFGDIQVAPNGKLYGTTVGPNSALYTINPQTAAATLVSPMGLCTYEGGLAFAPNGTAYGLNGLTSATGSQDELFTINLTTGAATLTANVGTAGLFDVTDCCTVATEC